MTTSASLFKRFASELLSPPTRALRDTAAEAARQLLHARHLVAYDWALPYVAGKDVLEIGTNSGYGSSRVMSCARSFVGLDLHFDLAARAQTDAGVRMLQGDGQHIPLRDASMDVVMTFQVIEHVWDDRAFLGEIHRVLRPGGLLLVSTPNSRTRLLLGQQPWNDEHIREYDQPLFAGHLSAAFDVVRLLGLFADDVATAVERARTRQDPWQHFFSGPWARPIRVASAVLGRLATAPSLPDVGSLATAGRTADENDLSRRFFFDDDGLDRALDLFALCEKSFARLLPESALVNTKGHWRSRYRQWPNLEATGTLGDPLRWQHWLYQGKQRAYARLLRRHNAAIRDRYVLDFGCGWGVFEDFWERRGAGRTGGIDVVPEPIRTLTDRFPNRAYLCADLAEDTSGLPALGRPDLITAIDVLYHIVDDEHLTSTLDHLLSTLAPDGSFLFTDALQEAETAPHVRFRSLNHWRQILARLSFHYVDREPVFILNNRLGRATSRYPAIIGAVSHLADLPLLRVAPWMANNWAVLARRNVSPTRLITR